jgi:hypothetical protein
LISLDTQELEQLALGLSASTNITIKNLCRGEFFEGTVIRDPGGEEWLTTERDRYRRITVDTLEKLLVVQ